MESFNGLYKTEVTRKDDPCWGLQGGEHATLDYVDWFNRRRLHGELGMTSPAEFEATYFHDRSPVRTAVSH